MFFLILISIFLTCIVSIWKCVRVSKKNSKRLEIFTKNIYKCKQFFEYIFPMGLFQQFSILKSFFIKSSFWLFSTVCNTHVRYTPKYFLTVLSREMIYDYFQIQHIKTQWAKCFHLYWLTLLVLNSLHILTGCNNC